MEAMGYVVGAADLCAASVGAPHIRQRLFWVADSKSVRSGEGRQDTAGSNERNKQGQGAVIERHVSCFGVADGGLGIANGSRPQQGNETAATVGYRDSVEPANFWDASVWWPCIDGKWRRVPARQNKLQRRNGTNTAAHEIQADTLCPEPSLFPLADGVSGRVGLLRGAGNAIVPQVAAEFIGAVIESIDDLK
jgi:DNA (cytosine-5)-methyltransferase 1